MLPSGKAKPEAFEVTKPSRSYTAFSDLEIIDNLGTASFSYNKLFHNDPFVLSVIRPTDISQTSRVNIGLNVRSIENSFWCLHIHC